MAILKHISVRNSDYGAAQRYLFFEHDPITQQPLLDEGGNMILRKGILRSALNCDPFTFNTECTELNRQWGKNLGKNDVRAHHYILSFDPRDVTENGLTPERAHGLAEEFSRRFFAGHQVLLVTHSDGHNQSGNIHTHIVLNSLRKETVPYQEFMERPTDALAGFKHHLTPALRAYMQIAANELCAREHLHTVDYTLPTEKKVNDREYQARRNGQRKLDARNAEIIADGFKPRRTKYETIKEQLRSAIDRAAQEARTAEQFKEILATRENITVSEKRGVWSFTHPDRQKPIRGRSLGQIYLREEILRRLGEAPRQIPPEYAHLPKIFLLPSDLRLVVDVQNCVKAQQSRAYARKVEISNLQQMAKSLVYIQSHGIGTLEKLQAAREENEQKYQALSDELRETRKQLTAINEQIHYLGQYLSAKSAYRDFIASPDKAAFRTAHKAEIDQYEASRDFLKQLAPDDKFPDMKTLKIEKDRLEHLMKHQKEMLKPVSKERKTLRTVQANMDSILGVQHERQIDAVHW